MGSTPPRSGSATPPPGALPASGAPAHVGMPATVSAATIVPVVSDDKLVKAACEKVCGSIVSVEFKPKDPPYLKSHITRLMNKLPASRQLEWEEMKKEIVGAERTTTGFVVGENKGHLMILTCAHSMAPCFNGDQPMTEAQVKRLFKIAVKCDHAELNHVQKYTPAEVYKVDTKKDMLLLKVSKKFCTESHLILEMAERRLPDDRLESIGMVSWPEDRHRTIVQGTMCHRARSIDSFEDDNKHGYDFEAVEITITSEPGSSGAPGVDTSGRVVGMLHAGNCDCITYFVSSDEITNMLKSWGIDNKTVTVAPVAGTGGSGKIQ